MLLVGSQALDRFISINRIMHDWDIWVNSEDYFNLRNKYRRNIVKENDKVTIFQIDDQLVEVKPVEKMDETDLEIFRNGKKRTRIVRTPVGVAWTADVQTLYDMKKATAECIDHHKHEYDLKLIENNFNVDKNTDLYQRRLIETKRRLGIENEKKFKFFHKTALDNGERIGGIPEYIEHDYLHTIIADLLDIKMPTYQRFLSGVTEIKEEFWEGLSHKEKISAMVEESLVLALERWFNPQMVENGINYRLIDMFYNNNEAMPTYKLLYHCCITGLKGEKECIVDFARNNFNEIEIEWRKAKEKIKEKDGFPNYYFDKLFDLRDKYRSGEKVGLHHKENVLND